MNAKAGLVTIIALLATLVAASAPAGVVTVPPLFDNTLYQDASGSLSNGAGPALFAGSNGSLLARRALLRFDVAGNVPAGAHITGVTLGMNVSNATDAIPRTFVLHRMLASWGEGTSSTTGGSGAAATAGDATWLHRFWPDSAWASAGGDFEPTTRGSCVITDVGAYTWTDPAMALDAQAWLDQPAGNFGWVLLGEEGLANTARRFDSRENPVPGVRPTLTIQYTVSAGVEDSDVRGVSLAPCHPNPAVGPTRFEFSLPAPARARLIVTDVTGRRIATLVDRACDAGRHTGEWDGRDDRGHRVASGVYLYRLVVDGRLGAARKLAVIH